MSELEIQVPAMDGGSYKVRIGSGILGSVWGRIEADFGGYGKIVVSDENVVSAGHLAKLLGGREVDSFVISPAGETSKNIDTVTKIIEAMEKACLGRDSVVVGLGGGTVGDIAGFAASIFKRGVSVVHIPTTTVAQADSAVGGKTGVDSTVSKNAYGVFWHPSAVYIDVSTLGTLDERQYRAGLVESVKHALIADSGYFEFIENNIDAILERKLDVLEKMADYNCKIKGSVVEADPNEKNQRRMLNYGHTIGHAVESASGFELLHGEAVSIGIIGAGLIEAKMGLSEPKRSDRVRKIFEKLGVPVTIPSNLDEKKLMELIRHDKKAVNKWPKFVLLEKIGTVHCQEGQWGVDVGRELVEQVLAELR
ncbi:MAG: 3-dehydroquinate synthase [Planctomycetes bacterium]|nr:3-dehydroquinate synthase [Planctomycetota bacterium]